MCIFAQAPSTAGSMTPTPKKSNHFVFFPVGQHNMEQKEWNYLEHFLGTIPFNYSLIEIESHTDKFNKAEKGNTKLSDMRAAAVKTVLMGFGFPAAKIIVKSYGSTRSVSEEKSDLTSQENRRVRLIVHYMETGNPKDKVPAFMPLPIEAKVVEAPKPTPMPVPTPAPKMEESREVKSDSTGREGKMTMPPAPKPAPKPVPKPAPKPAPMSGNRPSAAKPAPAPAPKKL